MLGEFPWDNNGKPILVNEKGYEFYIDKDMTDYAKQDDINGNKGLIGIICYYMKKGDYITRMLVDNKTQTPLHLDQTMEGMACYIDFMKIAFATHKNI
jgi:hypothetical protein